MLERVFLEDRITRLFEDKLNLAVPSSDTDLLATGALDSLSFVELLLALEREFAVKISLENMELENFQSIARISEFISNYQESKGGEQEQGPLDRQVLEDSIGWGRGTQDGRRNKSAGA